MQWASALAKVGVLLTFQYNKSFTAPYKYIPTTQLEMNNNEEPIPMPHLNLRALATGAGSPGYKKVPKAASPENKKVPRAGSPKYIYVQQGWQP